MTPRFAFDTTITRLPDRLYARVGPTPVRRPGLVRINGPLAEELGLDPQALASEEGLAVLAGNAVPEGATPLALAYAGHQFGHFVPSLGDGRALLLGEIVGRDGRRRDVQLKGSGRTPFSRGGDGRAALGPVLREYIVAEAMHALGIPTTRALAAVTTGEPVFREGPLLGAVLTRVAASHLRVGTMQFAAARGDTEGLRALVAHALQRHDPGQADSPTPARALLDGVLDRQAALVARWLLVGFVHGVMNTDNTTLSGETIDYGPCAFLDRFDPGAVWSSIDHHGRYAYAQQPRIVHWNLSRLAEALLPLLSDEAGGDEGRGVEIATASLDRFGSVFAAHHEAGLCRKIGLTSPRPGDAALAEALLARMARHGADFTLTFRGLAHAAAGSDGDAAWMALFGGAEGRAEAASWLPAWRARLAEEARTPSEIAEALRRENPAIHPRNHLVEQAIAAAAGKGDLGPFHALVDALTHPFDEPADPRHALPPADEEVVTQTFCGT